ncbi:MAG: hypothetical protein CME59_04035 [Halioglobus sp.]|nr:hypothetical protein [Halioglobus sp.]|tara:strand:+ start:4308 stop:5282 length:975 start_codon:yes stop_codon:yes gene_type:complete
MTVAEISPDIFAARDLDADNAAMMQRIERFRDVEASAAPGLIIPPGQQDGDIDTFIPEVHAADFDIERLRDALREHGSLIVRGLFPAASMQGLIPAIDRVLDACERNSHGDTPQQSAYFNPPQNLITIMPNKGKELGNTRNFHRDSGSAMCVEAPSVAEALLAFYERHGLKSLMREYLREPPCLTAKKWVLRRSKLPVAEAGWHQDGAFMGTDINSINMWLPLNECGGETGAPGMDVLPRRLHNIASAEGAQFDWSVSSNQVAGQSGGSVLLRPVFQAGDAFFFDHFFLHRTQYGIAFDKLRYAVETWFFGESSFPKNQIPLAW